MIQRLLFDRIHAKTRRAAIADELDLIVDALAHVAKPALSFPEPAVPGAQIALDAAVFQGMPVFSRNDRSVHVLLMVSQPSHIKYG